MRAAIVIAVVFAGKARHARLELIHFCKLRLERLKYKKAAGGKRHAAYRAIKLAYNTA